MFHRGLMQAGREDRGVGHAGKAVKEILGNAGLDTSSYARRQPPTSFPFGTACNVQHVKAGLCQSS